MGKGRGLSVYATVMFGATTLGSLIWGEVGSRVGLPAAHFAAALGALACIPLLRHRHLQTGAKLALTPSIHWPEPVPFKDIAEDRGPVLVTVEYDVALEHRDAFLSALCHVAAERKRDGAYRWGVFEDTARPGHWIETVVLDSWLEHLRQHARVSHADREHEALVRKFQRGGEPTVTHYIAPNWNGPRSP